MGLSGLKSFETPLAGASLGGPLVSRGLWVFDHERIRGHHQEQPALHLHRGTDHNTRAHSHTDCSRVTFCRDMHKGHARSCIAFLFSIFCVLTIVVLLWCCYGIEANILNRAFSPLGVHHFHSILTRAFVRLLNACMGFRCAVSSPLLEHLLGKALYSGCPPVKPHSCSLPNICNLWVVMYIFCRPQNQFFISCADGRSVHNGIGDAIVERILQAHKCVWNFLFSFFFCGCALCKICWWQAVFLCASI